MKANMRLKRNEPKSGMKKQYWFSIETYVHIALKNDSLLLYNTLNGKALEYSGEGEQKILNLVKKMKSTRNMQVIRLTGDDLEDPAIAQFVAAVMESFMGELIDTSHSRKKPVQMIPILTVNNDVKHLKKDASRSVGEGMMPYLTEIFLYIHNGCEHNCGICAGAYKQFPCCTIKKNRNGNMDAKKIQMFLDEIKSSSFCSINILGGDIFAHTEFEKIIEILNSGPVQKTQKTLYCHYLNVIKHGIEGKGEESSGNIQKLNILNARTYTLKIQVTFPLNEEKFRAALETVKAFDLNAKFVFIIESEADYEQAEALATSCRAGNYDFQPFYNGGNLEFFKQNVFPGKDEILESRPSLIDIFQNSAVNKNNFGRLTVFNNGDIYANVNASRLGVLGKDSIYDVLYKEMYRGQSWRRIRKNVGPCKCCTFQSLCPPLSNYNHIIGRNDLCHKTFKTGG